MAGSTSARSRAECDQRIRFVRHDPKPLNRSISVEAQGVDFRSRNIENARLHARSIGKMPGGVARRMETDKEKNARFDLDEAALFFHKYPTPGKLEIQATKPLGNQRDLALAYSPGVAAPCLAIRDDPGNRRRLHRRAPIWSAWSPTASAVLGLGNIGPLASKPVMEGKAVLFKKFAGIDVFDIEIDAPGIERMVEHDLGAGADLRRHQPRGHQGAGMLRGRGAAEGTHGHPGLPRRPARHGDHRRGRRAQRAGTRRQEDRRTSRSSPRARARRRSPASTSWSRSAPRSRTSGSPTASASPTRAASRRWTAGRTPTSRTRRRARWPMSSTAPTSSSACRRRAC